ncbi:MAG: DUF1778 domain-containing protein [Alphaproteobacteria bacterium]|nr:DUF1778 domain-containing protein [Alphaproteobacteria bacterium]
MTALKKTASKANPKTPRKSARFDIRVTPELHEMVVHAALLEGRNTSDFMADAVREAATRSIERHERWVLSKQDREIFLNALLNPPEPSAKALEAVARYRRMVERR